MVSVTSPVESSAPRLLPVFAGLLALGIFAADTFSNFDVSVAVLYVAVVLLSLNFMERRGVLAVSLGCAALTVLSYVIQHGVGGGEPLGRLGISLVAIGATAFLSLEQRAATATLAKQARLLDLTHDTIFVRNAEDVITYWNRGAEALYGWRSDQAIGTAAHELLRTSFPAPLEEITAELLRLGRWEGELVHTTRDGKQITVASRWAVERDDSGRPIAVLEANTDITDRKRAEEKIRHAEKKLRLTIDTIPALVASATPDGKIDFVNARWIEAGFSEDDIRSGPARIFHPDQLGELEEKRMKAWATGEPFEIEARLRRADGEYRWFLLRVVALRDRSGTIIRRFSTASDIEDRKRAEEALRRSEALLAETQRLSHTGTIGLDVASGEPFWSDEGLRIFGFDPPLKPSIDQVLQRVHPEDLWLAQRSIDRAMRGEFDNEVEIRLVMPDGSVKYVHAASPAAPDRTTRREAIRALIDVTAIREAEAALREAQAELAHVTRVTTLGEFSASIAHEVNQPLAAVVTNGEICIRLLDREGPDLSEVREAVGDIIRNGMRASEIIQRLRALAKKTKTEMARLDVNDVIEEVIPLVQREVLGHQVVLRRDLAASLPEVLADRVQMQQVIINLLINGMEAMAAVAGRPRELTIRSLADADGQTLVAIHDTGVGLDPAAADQLFDAFYTTKPGGMGMGLSICRSIIDNHGGRIWASRNDGHGTTFQFTLPPHMETRP